MAIYCPQCGREHPDDANFCMKCGKPLKGGATPITQSSPQLQWEYRDHVVPLNFTDNGDGGFIAGHAAPYANQTILSYLQQAGQDGWQTDGPTDFVELYYAHRVNLKDNKNFLGDIKSQTFFSATLRLKRLVRQ